ncbi:FeoB-associated Cys-rich membrane protein [Ohessyouella blattaphilus]|uniref:FeoB-associated Cys-rich membrane protein n=1 Tax=Ohessyouella blattaphilus TaxID=2949333 RepID=A0ABT1EKR4_9FIRM|nr:FeoB-associated Cys-rich membrane protein [Ohessyouella blattaphilus]MCP1111296.1 FeoB-associated Cys-rich membrane protein [Ohessyouella blattaphilus]MCR8564690.1 FeoB-associated Cys-rich membrane protein [Ohessyouella blattaphilus]MDL2251094.1 FeoB-associated Cys-rich membrane protein [Lachnospiraceae bacterium OttesenSCG-928-J05]
MATIIIAIGLIAVVALIIRSMVKRKKSGKGSCGCDCGSCAMGCHEIPSKPSSKE